MCNYLTLATWLLRGRRWEKFDTDVGEVYDELNWLRVGANVVISSLQAAAASLGPTNQRGTAPELPSAVTAGVILGGEPVSSAPAKHAFLHTRNGGLFGGERIKLRGECDDLWVGLMFSVAGVSVFTVWYDGSSR